MDNAAFADAQKRLTDYVGEQVVLLFPTETVWPPGTKLDPESGKPLDPWADAGLVRLHRVDGLCVGGKAARERPTAIRS
jgi:hypothetical protein